MGTRGTAETRAKEAAKAARILGVSIRENVGLPDAGLAVVQEQKLAVAEHIRRAAPPHRDSVPTGKAATRTITPPGG